MVYFLKLVFALIKALVAIAISPILCVLFYKWNKAFLFLMTHLWPNLSILDENNKLYLRRFFLTPKMKWYRPRFLHYIAQSDNGRNPHDHPAKFTTKILHGGYIESVYYPRNIEFRKKFGLCTVTAHFPGEKLINPEGHTHQLDLLAPTWTWLIGWHRGRLWGFWDLHPTDASEDVWIESTQYGMKGVELKSWEKWF